jgi:hypothetical protein
MKCNAKESMKRQICKEIAETLDEQRIIWELLTLTVLHDEFGFGEGRLERWGNAVQKIYNEFTDESRSTDTPYRKGTKKMSNMDTAIIRRLQGLRSYNIDYRKILGIEDVKVDGESIDTVLDRMEKGRTV